MHSIYNVLYILEIIPKTAFFSFVYYLRKNKLSKGEYLFLYLYFIFRTWGCEKISMIKKGHECKKFKKLNSSSSVPKLPVMRVTRAILVGRGNHSQFNVNILNLSDEIFFKK